MHHGEIQNCESPQAPSYQHQIDSSSMHTYMPYSSQTASVPSERDGMQFIFDLLTASHGYPTFEQDEPVRFGGCLCDM